MHELAITEALLEQVRTHVGPGAVVREVHVDIGGLEHLDHDVMQTAWTALTIETAMAGAVLHLQREPVFVRCRSCEHAYEPTGDLAYVCPACGTARPTIVRGSGVVLRSLEIDDPAADSGPPPPRGA